MAQVQRKKMMWYYSSIIDWMIANPGRPLSECARYIGRTQSTLSIIINSDMFKAALAQRKAEFQMSHDFGIIEKTTQIAHKGLDAILAVLDKKKDTLPLETLEAVTGSALKRLGYGLEKPQGPSISLQVNGDNAQVVLPVSAQDLAEARMALRQVQAQKLPRSSEPLLLEDGAESVKIIEEDAVASVIRED